MLERHASLDAVASKHPVRRLGGIPALAARIRLLPASPESAQLARVHLLLASWQAGVTPGCDCGSCLIMRTAAAELRDALDGETDPLYVGVEFAEATEGAGHGRREQVREDHHRARVNPG